MTDDPRLTDPSASKWFGAKSPSCKNCDQPVEAGQYCQVQPDTTDRATWVVVHHVCPSGETARFDSDGNFLGHEPRACGEHRTVGAHRAWCFDCTEWCYPRFDAACIRCRHPEG